MQPVTDPALLAQLNRQADPATTRALNARAAGELAFEGTGPLERFGLGLAKSGVETFLGIKDLFTDLTEAEQAELERLQAIQGPAALLGEIAADVASMALPGGAVAKGGKWAAKLSNTGRQAVQAFNASRTAQTAGTVATAAAQEALKAPVIDRSRAERATEAAIGAGLVTGAPRVLRRALAGKRNPVAQELLERGIPLTVGRANGPIRRLAEDQAAALPWVGGAINSRVMEGISAWNRDLLQRANPLPKQAIEKAGREGFAQLQGNFRQAYGDVWRNLTKADLKGAGVDMSDLLRQVQKAVPVDEQGEVMRIINNANDEWSRFLQTDDGRSLEVVDDLLRETGHLNPQSRDFLNQFRHRIQAKLPDGVGQRIREIDRKYFDYIALQKAGSYKNALGDEMFAPGQLISAAKQQYGPRASVAGRNTPMLDEALKAAQVFGENTPSRQVLRKLIGTGAAGASLLTLGGSPTLAALALGRALYGRKAQQAILQPFESQSLAARLLRGAGYTGGAYAANEAE